MTCWGYDRFGQTNAPSGRFIPVSAGYRHACALSVDGVVSCWGNDGLSVDFTIPGGSYRSVSSGAH